MNTLLKICALVFFVTIASASAAELHPRFESALPNEAALTEGIRRGILGLQERIGNAVGRKLRGTHAKGVCANARFEVLSDNGVGLLLLLDMLQARSDERLITERSLGEPTENASSESIARLFDRRKVGLYASEGSYAAKVRFANAASSIESDLVPDVRAMSVAVELPANERFAGVRRQDFVMNNHPSFPIRDALSFVVVMKGSALGRNALSDAEKVLFDEAVRLGELQKSPGTTSYLNMDYYSGTPYLHGSNDAVKYSFKKYSEVPGFVAGENGLSTHVKNVLADRGAKPSFVFGLQYFEEARFRTALANGAGLPASHWIEDATLVWDENLSPFLPVALLSLESNMSDEDCEKISFDVTLNTLNEHRGLGSINRARAAAERASAEARGSN
jgi:hypothetical protein